MTEREYREHPAVSRSELFKILDSPEKFKYYKENPEPPTPALLFGQLFHAMVLQPKEVWEQFAVMPKVDRRTKDGKEVWEQFLIDSAEKTVVPMDMVEKAAEMCIVSHSRIIDTSEQQEKDCHRNSLFLLPG